MTHWVASGLIVVCIVYLIVRWRMTEVPAMVLDRGGFEQNGLLMPDFSREDLMAYIEECREASISSELAKEFVVAMYNTLRFTKEPPAPKLTDDRYEVWALDDDVGEPLNYVLARYQRPHVRWDDPEVLDLRTIEDVLHFLDERANRSVHRTAYGVR